MGYRGEWFAKIRSTLIVFEMKYPKAFFPKDSPDTVPLAIGIHQVLIDENPQINPLLVVTALRRYLGKNRYQRALATKENRMNLDGSVFGPVSEKHRAHAIAELAKRQAKEMAKAA